MSPNRVFFYAGLAGLLGVALGAFGAHALHDSVAQRQTAALWQTAVFYHLIHAVGLLGLAGWTGCAPAIRSWCRSGLLDCRHDSVFRIALRTGAGSTARVRLDYPSRRTPAAGGLGSGRNSRLAHFAERLASNNPLRPRRNI